MNASIDRLAELLDAEPPAVLDALVLERVLATFRRCAASSKSVPSEGGPSKDVERPARDRAPGPPAACPLLNPARW